LIAALSVELVAPTVFALHQEAGASHHGDPYAHFFALLIGAVLGGILFVILDQLVNAHGGFLRKTATSITYFRIAERERQEKLVEKLSQLPLLQNVSAQHVNALVSMVRPMGFNDGEVMARQGEEANLLFFVMKGAVSVTRDGSSVGESGPDNVIGIIPILTQIPNPGTVTAKGPVTALALSKENFDRLRNISPAFDQACRDLTRERLEQLEQLVTARHEQAIEWAREATHALKTGTQIPSAAQLRRAKEEDRFGIAGATASQDGTPRRTQIRGRNSLHPHCWTISVEFSRGPCQFRQHEAPGLEQVEYFFDVVFPHGDHRYWRWFGLFASRRVGPYLVDLCRRAGGRSHAYHDCCGHDT
jgi:CRP-like cAMP-binding protein